MIFFTPFDTYDLTFYIVNSNYLFLFMFQCFSHGLVFNKTWWNQIYETWKWLALSMMSRPSLPRLGLLGQRKCGWLPSPGGVRDPDPMGEMLLGGIMLDAPAVCWLGPGPWIKRSERQFTFFYSLEKIMCMSIQISFIFMEDHIP